jgi:hypothetical protein
LVPLDAVATPSPSPGLETTLANPPTSDFKEDASLMSIHGTFDAHQYVQFLNPQDNQGTESTLRSDGFVLGFSRTWVQDASNHVLLEVVIAFSGRAGAKKWLGKSELVDKSDTYYRNAISIDGISTYYGAHFADPTTALYADVVSFVKGNDYFLIGVVSRADDLGDVAPQQTRRQFDAAPDYTIPPSQWPEAAGSIVVGHLLVPRWVAFVAGGALVLIVLVVVGSVLFMRRRPSGSRTLAGPRMSDDHRYWWDGQAWRDANEEVPPDAQRSEDGAYWWDGGSWRSIRPKAEPR